jgi:hypothetical protein
MVDGSLEPRYGRCGMATEGPAENWAIFEGYDQEKIVDGAAPIVHDDPDLVGALETLGLTLVGHAA